MESYLCMLDAGWCPVCVGADVMHDSSQPVNVDSNGRPYVMVKMARDDDRVMIPVTPVLSAPKDSIVLTKRTALEPGSDVGIIGGAMSPQNLTRIATVQGNCPFTRPGYGLGTEVMKQDTVHIVGMDIEQTTYLRNVTWDNRRYCAYAYGTADVSKCAPDDSYHIVKCANSTELADWALQWIIDESPDFVAVHNGFGFDVSRLAAHCSPEYMHCFTRVNLGKVSKGVDLSIPGVTVVDTWWYIDKLHGPEYASTSLDAICKAKGIGGKVKSPPMMIDPSDSSYDYSDMIVCNMYDAYLHIRVALDTKCLDEIIAIGVLTKSPLADCTRFISGTLMTNLTSAVALDAGCVMDWSAEPLRQGKYRGAIVLDPSVGFHRNVFTLDFKSLYPSIMIGLNISPETVTTFDVYDDDVREQYVELMGLRADGSMTWTSDATLLRMNDVIVSIDRRAEGIQPKFLKYLMTKRSAIKKSNGGKDTPLSFAMKIAANSTYGACGSSTSGMSTRYGAASVTATGRTLLSLAVAIATLLGFEALYGDTDSIFLRMPEGSRFTVYNYQVIQSLWLCHWGFSVSWTRGILHFLL